MSRRLATPHRSQRTDYPEPPKGYVLIATSADFEAAGAKKRGDMVWVESCSEWMPANSGQPLRKTLIYARKLDAK
jgi:hypothetical protein